MQERAGSTISKNNATTMLTQICQGVETLNGPGGVDTVAGRRYTAPLVVVNEWNVKHSR